MSEGTEAFCDAEKEAQRQQKGRRNRIVFLIGTWTLIAAVFLGIMMSTRMKTNHMLLAQQEVTQQRLKTLHFTNQLMDASDCLSAQLWRFASTEEVNYAYSFLDRVLETNQNYIELEALCAMSFPQEELYYLKEAKKISQSILEKEKWVLRLLFEAQGNKELPKELAQVALSPGEERLSRQEKEALAKQYVFGEVYARRKTEMKENLRNFEQMQSNLIHLEELQADEQIERVMERNIMMGLLIISWLLMLQIGIYFLLIRPVSEYSQRLIRQRAEGADFAPLDLQGSSETKALGLAFNQVLSQLQEAKQLLQKQNEELLVLSKTDHLTKVLNRLAMENYMEKLLEEYRGTNWPIGLIMLDLDYFKRFNDSYGHPAGDDALRHVAEVLSGIVDQKGGLISRMGGEEFFILLPGQGEEELALLAEELLIAIRETDFTVAGDTKKVLTISMGSYIYRGGNETLKLLYTYADKALYAAKKQGRNRHVTYESLLQKLQK